MRCRPNAGSSPDWRGFDHTKLEGPDVDSYWFSPDYMAWMRCSTTTGELEVPLVGHSMGGNIAAHDVRRRYPSASNIWQ
jgi:pimeloyl-ACP methyl ester carboxylesterase